MTGFAARWQAGRKFAWRHRQDWLRVWLELDCRANMAETLSRRGAAGAAASPPAPGTYNLGIWVSMCLWPFAALPAA